MLVFDTIRRLNRLFAIAAVLIFLSSPTVFAASTGVMLSQDEIVQKVLEQGYAKVIRMEMEDGVYEVKAKTQDGERVNLNVDPNSGKILGMHKDGLFSN